MIFIPPSWGASDFKLSPLTPQIRGDNIRFWRYPPYRGIKISPGELLVLSLFIIFGNDIKLHGRPETQAVENGPLFIA